MPAVALQTDGGDPDITPTVESDTQNNGGEDAQKEINPDCECEAASADSQSEEDKTEV